MKPLNQNDEAAKRDALKRFYQDSLFEFGHTCIGNHLLVPHVHGAIELWLRGKNRKRLKLLMLPRDSLKTTFVSVIYSLWSAINNPNVNILVDSQSRALSKTILASIKDTIDRNEGFKAVFGDLNGSAKNLPWNETEATISSRTTFNAKEATFETTGVEVTSTGRHYDKIICDDIHDMLNSQSQLQINKVIRHVQTLFPLLRPNGEMVVIGTFWTYDDAYTWLINMVDDEGQPMFDSLIKPAAVMDEKGDFHELLFPERLDNKTLKEKRATMRSKTDGEYLFTTQFLLDPVPKTSRMFRSEDWKRIAKNDIPKECVRFIMVDPSLGESNHSDYTAIVCVAVNPNKDELGLRKLYLADGVFGRFGGIHGESLICTEIVAMFMRNRPIAVGIEKSGMNSLGYAVKNHIKAKGIHISEETFVDLNHANRSKANRIRALQPYSSNGKIYISNSLSDDFYSELKEELERQPRPPKDDLADATAYVLDMMGKFDDQLSYLENDSPNVEYDAPTQKTAEIDLADSFSITGY